MRLNLHLLRIFYTVIEQQSFSGAARVLFISQPAVSKAVRELENQLDLILIERNVGISRGLRMTENGVALFEHARGIFGLERAAIEDIQARIGLRKGRLIVGASFTIAGYWLPSYVASFTRQFPSIDLHIHAGNTQAICTALIDCNCDVGLVEGAIEDPRITVTHWRDDELCLVASHDEVLSRKLSLNEEDLSAETWLLRESGSGTREVTERLMQEHNIVPKRIVEFGSNEGIARAVAGGAGIAMLPAIVVNELIKIGGLATLNYPLDRPLLRPLFLVQLQERTFSPLADAFCKIINFQTTVFEGA